MANNEFNIEAAPASTSTLSAAQQPIINHISSENVINNSHASSLMTNSLELLAERPQVNIERVASGTVKLSKKILTQTINVPVTLTREVLVIESHVPTSGNQNPDNLITIDQDNPTPTQILVNGQAIALSEKPVEILLSQQTARVKIETLIAERVNLSTQTSTHEVQIPVTLRHEELVSDYVDLENNNLTSKDSILSTQSVDNK